tara:strand:- start:8555 stop:9319 length:765 start_codon:yes stop_codon:yes gene_type:complete
MAIPLALALAPAAIQAGTGIYQAVRGNQLRNSMDRPTYEIPQEILDSLTDAQIQALRGMPAEQKQQYLDNVMRSQQASLDAMGDRKAGLAGLAGVQQTALDAYRNMLSMDAQQRQANEQALQNTRGVVAGFRDKAFDYNQAQPYDQTMAAAEGMTGAGMQNIMGGVQAGSQMGLDAVMFNQYMDSIGGSGDTTTTTTPPTNTVLTQPVVPPTQTAFQRNYGNNIYNAGLGDGFAQSYPNSANSASKTIYMSPNF